MKSFKSQTLLQDRLKPRFNRKSRRASRQRPSREDQLLIANPFLQREEQSFLPSELKKQVQNIDYLSPKRIQGMTFNTVIGARRSSAIARQLQVMQNAAKKQEGMYEFFMGYGTKKQENSDTEIMQEEQPITIEQNDNLSTKMNQCFFIMDTDHIDQDSINFFSQESEEEIVFYSQHIIQSEDLSEEYQAYFDV